MDEHNEHITSEINQDSSTEIPVHVREQIQNSLKGARSERLAYEEAPPPSEKFLATRKAHSLTDSERYWAAMAHGSILLTIALGISSAGLSSFLTIFIPLGIYFFHRKQSPFVAHHALQAFIAQVVGIVGFMLLILSVIMVWTVLLVISAILILILIGIPLTILVLIAGLIAIPATLVLPFMTLIYGMIATVQAWQGESYKYPWIGDWVDQQLFEY